MAPDVEGIPTRAHDFANPPGTRKRLELNPMRRAFVVDPLVWADEIITSDRSLPITAATIHIAAAAFVYEPFLRKGANLRLQNPKTPL